MRQINMAAILFFFGQSVSICTGAEPVSTERHQKARAHYDLGKGLFRLKRFQDAAAEFESGYRYEPLPMFLYNAAQAYRMSGDGARAISYYQQYLQTHPDDKEAKEIQKYLSELKSAALSSKGEERPERSETSAPVPAAAEPSTKPDSTPAAQSSAVAVSLTQSFPPPRKSHRGLIIGLTMGGVAVVAGVVVLATLLTVSKGPPSSDLGNYRPFP
jgi:outer membrane protein assembly factor BamD (BamD/ComL family)